jgi:hypothetical protein
MRVKPLVITSVQPGPGFLRQTANAAGRASADGDVPTMAAHLADWLAESDQAHAPQGRRQGSKGPSKTKSVTPVVGGWVRGQKRNRVQIYFFNAFVFLLPSPRNAQKLDKQNRENIGFGFLAEYFESFFFRHGFFGKTFL